MFSVQNSVAAWFCWLRLSRAVKFVALFLSVASTHRREEYRPGARRQLDGSLFCRVW